MSKTVIYYDYTPGYGVNATCREWPFRNEYFRSWGEFRSYVNIEYAGSVELVEITAENYPQLCAEGIFDE